ncbi:hypothetical protein E0Z10_g5338 [Xylaria hypoxylon]|uniref:RRM domain-containing protein n=1 Tax=Xylaria hypoxylon TaxID=37992 RepID=A0A4Z0YTZ9_9PEZI|nr:hypothetical protein E0Z10_g5338 [Xylaria hypoxylon]
MSEETALVPAQSGEVAAPAPKKVKKIIRKKRPARPQVDSDFIKSEPPPQTGTIFNIWYNKWSGGDREDKYLAKTAAKGRCNIQKDSGYTRADKVTGSYFCLFFAEATKGAKAGEVEKIAGFAAQEIVSRHWAEFGEVERVRVLNTRGVAFITFRHEANAQFAKEAMAHQSLDHNEILNVRWATADPNPMAQAREARRIEEQAADAIRRALPAEFVAEIEGRDPEARKRRKIESGFGLEGYEAPDDIYFARGVQAVNPIGRQGYELEQEQRLMIESGEADAQQGEAQIGGIFSNSTLAALKTAKVTTAPKEKAAVSSGPLVDYGSDSDDDE